MAKASITNTTSTGFGDAVHFDPPIDKVVAQVAAVPQGTTGATGSVLIQGSINGADWETVISASTFADSRIVTQDASTGSGPWSALRAQLTAHSAGGAVSVHIDGK